MEKLRKPPMLILVLVLVTAGLYWQTVSHGFSVLDDDDYVTSNPWVNEGVSGEAMRWAFTTYHAANWHPLTWISHQVDWSLYGNFAGGHHLTNLLLHTANTLFLFLLLRSLTGSTGRSWIVAALFGWHPLRVESVAWIAERKDLLSALCLLGSLWAYCRYAKAGGTASPTSKCFFYALALGIFAAGLMCKPMIVTLPCLLLLLDFWPLQRASLSGGSETKRNWLKLFAEKIPFFTMSAAGCLVTIAAQDAGRAVKSTAEVPVISRGLDALSAYGTYLQQTFWPSPLCIFYPIPEQSPILPAIAGALLLAGVVGLAWYCRQRCPWLLMGWLWFVGTLVPVIGLVQVGMQAHADRYTYIPSIGLFIALVWGLHFVLSRKSQGEEVAVGVTAAGLLVCVLLTYHQLGYWQTSVKLFTHALAHTENNPFSQNNLGVAYTHEGNSQEAIVHYRDAIQLQPKNPQLHYNLGIELAKAGELAPAGESFTEALKYSPHSESLLNNLGVVLAQQGKYEQALTNFLDAILWNPSYPKSYLNAGTAYQALSQPGPAVTNFNIALTLDPNSIEALRHLAYLLATCPIEPYHQPAQAIQLAGRAAEITQGQVAEYLQTLAIAYAGSAQYSNAIVADEKALGLAQQQGATNLVGRLQSELQFYRSGKNPDWDWKQLR